MNKEHSALVEEIREAISSGALSKEAIEARLTKAVEEESFQQDHPADAEFLNVCLDMLANLKTGGQFSFTPKVEEAKAAVTEKYEERVRFRGITRRIVKVACALVVVLGVGCLGVLVPRFGWLSARSTPDEQQYVVQGQSVDVGNRGYADETIELQPRVLTTTVLDEAIAALKFSPLMPAKLPEGWSVAKYTIIEGLNKDRLLVTYTQNETGVMLIYEVCNYDTIDHAFVSFEQSKQGKLIESHNTQVYFSENTDNTLYTWIDGKVVYSVFGHVPNELLWEIVRQVLEGVER